MSTLAENKRYKIIASAVMALIIASATLAFSYNRTTITTSHLVSHAGGIIEGQTYTNSLEALNNSAKNSHRLIEVDMDFTADGKLVLVHGWKDHYLSLFINPTQSTPTQEEFMALKMKYGLHQLTIEDLFAWLDENPDITIITDIKTGNFKALKFIADNYKDAKHRFIPQFYSPDNFGKIKSLGFDNLILTLYRTEASNKKILEFAKNNKIYAYTMFPYRGAWKQLSNQLHALNQRVYFHTINNISEAQSLKRLGAYGFYTDSMTPVTFPYKQ